MCLFLFSLFNYFNYVLKTEVYLKSPIFVHKHRNLCKKLNVTILVCVFKILPGTTIETPFSFQFSDIDEAIACRRQYVSSSGCSFEFPHASSSCRQRQARSGWRSFVGLEYESGVLLGLFLGFIDQRFSRICQLSVSPLNLDRIRAISALWVCIFSTPFYGSTIFKDLIPFIYAKALIWHAKDFYIRISPLGFPSPSSVAIATSNFFYRCFLFQLRGGSGDYAQSISSYPMADPWIFFTGVKT